MTTIESQILETWRINHRTNLLLISQMTDESLRMTTSKRGGGTVGHQLAHMYNVRFWKLERTDKSLVKNMKSIKAIDEKTVPILEDLHKTSAVLIEQIFKVAWKMMEKSRAGKEV